MTAGNRPWLAAYPAGVPADIAEPETPLTAFLDQAVARYGDQVALDFLGATTTYAQLGEQVARAATALYELGVRPGDRVALILPNCPAHVVAFYATLRLGAIVVEHNPLYTAAELERQLADHGAEVAICWEKVAATVDSLRSSTAVRTIIAVDLTTALPRGRRLALLLPIPPARRMRAELRGPVPAGALRWDRLLSGCAPLPPEVPGPEVGDVALLQYTGGTTGSPKGAILTHRNLAANSEQSVAWVPDLNEGGETFYGILPLFHAYGLTLCLTTAIRIGACVVLFPRFDADLVLSAYRRRPATFVPGVPPMYEKLAAACRQRGLRLPTIRYAISGAMSLPPETVGIWEELTGGLLVEGYGMTETSPIAIGNPMSTDRRPSTVGVPWPSTSVRIVDPENPMVDRPLGQPGELLISGPQVFAGYWQLPEETAHTLLDGGWIRTGDIAVMDADGYISIVDRIKEIIITGGFNVYPSEVEDVLREHPDVADVAVVGMPSRGSGEQVVAVVVPVAGTTIEPEALRRWARERLSGYKTPRRVVIVDDLPRSQIGKVLRRQVRETLPGAQPQLVA